MQQSRQSLGSPLFFGVGPDLVGKCLELIPGLEKEIVSVETIITTDLER